MGIQAEPSGSRRTDGFAARAIWLLQHRWFIAGCFAVHMAVRVAILLFPISPASDASWYFERAKDIAAGRGYSEHGAPTAYWPVGWPAFLAVVLKILGPHALAGELANLALSAGSFFLCLGLGRALFQDELTARLGVTLLAVYPNNAAYVSGLFSETYLTFLLLLGCWLYIRKRSSLSAATSGIVFGVAVLTKSQMLLVPLILIWVYDLAVPWSWTAVAKRTLVVYVAIGLVVAPWAYRNYNTFGHPVLATNGGINLFLGNNPSARGGYAQRYTEKDALTGAVGFSVADQIAADRRAAKLALDWIQQNPTGFLELIPIKVLRLWALDGEAEWQYQLGYPAYQAHAMLFRTMRALNQLYYVVLMIGFLGAPLIWRWYGRSCPRCCLVGYGLAAYLTLISAVFFGNPRFHFPAMGFVVIHCGSAVMTVLRGVESGANPEANAISDSRT